MGQVLAHLKTLTDLNGHFEFTKGRHSGRFYAKTRQKVAQEGNTKVVCLGGALQGA